MLFLPSACSGDPAGFEPGPPAESSFIDSAECGECHLEQYEDWKGSHHQLAMQPANEQTVLGDFEDRTFTHFGVTSRFFRRDGRYFVETEGADGQLGEYEIAYVFGLEPLQQYLIEFPGGRLQCLTISWDTIRKEWFHLYPNEKIRAEDELHWTGRYQNWNLMCAECHTTHLEKNYDPDSDSYATAFHEIGVTCQACHGPGETHVVWARAAGEGEAPENGDYGLAVGAAGGARREIEACAPCHSRRGRLTESFRHTGSFQDHFAPQLLDEGLYFPDGQILDEVYVYGSFLQSKMYREGVRCSDCHDPHSTRLKAEGNTICVQCHQQAPIDRFPTLRQADYDSPEHHFHPPDTPGALCVSCHMPERTYMVVDPRRDHSFRIPRPDLSVQLGTPNACTQCHGEESDRWAQEKVTEWYGEREPPARHFGEAIDAGRNREEGAGRRIIAMIEAPETAPIVRATLLDLLRSYGDEGVETRRRALEDADPLVRFGAVRSFEFLDPELRIESVFPLLDDPVRHVRVEAARVLLTIPPDALSGSQRAKLSAARGEYEQTLMAMADMPSSHLNLGILRQVSGEEEEAERSYQKAIRMDGDFLPAYMNLANLYNTLGRNQEAEGILRRLIQRGQEGGEVHYSLGLILAEMGRLEDAARSLARASHLLPNRARIRYNYALTLQHLGRRSEAESALLEAHRVDARDPDILYALVVFYSQEEDWARALEYAERLQRAYPGESGPAQLILQLRSRLRQ